MCQRIRLDSMVQGGGDGGGWAGEGGSGNGALRRPAAAGPDVTDETEITDETDATDQTGGAASGAGAAILRAAVDVASVAWEELHQTAEEHGQWPARSGASC
jgi:hypothetical protein